MNSEILFWSVFISALILSWKMAHSLYTEINSHMKSLEASEDLAIQTDSKS